LEPPSRGLFAFWGWEFAFLPRVSGRCSGCPQAASGIARAGARSRSCAGCAAAGRVPRWAGARVSSQTWRGAGVCFGGCAPALWRGGASAARRSVSGTRLGASNRGALGFIRGDAAGRLRYRCGACPDVKPACGRAAGIEIAGCGGAAGIGIAGALVRRPKHQATNFATDANICSTPLLRPRARSAGRENFAPECPMLVGGQLRCVADQVAEVGAGGRGRSRA
jgi:hypothetical protein